MQEVIKYTYLMDPKKVELHLDRLWTRYQQILNHPSWEELNEARAIIYFIGHLFCEEIAPQALQRRLHLLKHPLTFYQFLYLIDSNSSYLEYHRQDLLFCRLEHLYFITKKFKNRHTEGRYYLDEEKFIKLYQKYNPHSGLKLGWRGWFKRKR